MLKNKKSGFTLIELLVVIAIIGVLSSVVLASLNTARKKSRDARRVSDIKQMQTALELYFDANSQYPSEVGATGLAKLSAGGFIAQVPVDPVGATPVPYLYNPYVAEPAAAPAGIGDCTAAEVCIWYHLAAEFEESGGPVLKSDRDLESGAGGIMGDENAGNTDCTNTAAIKHCYDVTP